MSILDVTTSKWGFIKCKGQDLVVDINKRNASPGASVISWSKKADVTGNQIWAFGPNSSVVSQLTGLVLDVTDAEKVVTAVYNPESKTQRWSMTGTTILHTATNKVLDITGGLLKGVQLCVWSLKPVPAANQQWEFVEVATPKDYVVPHQSVLDARAAAVKTTTTTTTTPSTTTTTTPSSSTPTTTTPSGNIPSLTQEDMDSTTGTKTTTESSTSETGNTEDASTSASSFGKVLLGVSLLVAIGVGVGGYVYYTTSTQMKKKPTK